MPLADRDANASGRNSRASNMSAASRPPSKGAGPGFGPPAAKQPDFMPAGVASMTRTSIESNLGGLTGDTGYSNMPRPPRQGGTTSRQSVGSSRSNRSSRTSGRRGAVPPSSSSGPRHAREQHTPQYTPQYTADVLEETAVYIPGTSPLGPLAHDTQGSYRTQSMTMANTSGPTGPKLASRSCNSLQPVRNNPRPQVPPGQQVKRPISPAPNKSRHGPGGGGPGRASHPGQQRIRYPSESSIRRDNRARMVDRPPKPETEVVIYGDPGPGIPPVPPIPEEFRVHSAPGGAPLVNKLPEGYHGAGVPKSQKSAKTSISSRSTNRHTDSDGPSSDAPSPPTPRDGASMGVLAHRIGNQLVIGDAKGIPKAEVMSGPLYYDYSEQFATDTVEADASGLPTGFVHSFKPIVEEQATTDPPSHKGDPSIAKKVIEQPVAGVPEIAELSASPVPRRLTRNMILAVLEPVSTTGDFESSEGRSGSKDDDESVGHDKEEQHSSDAANGDPAVPSLLTQEEVKNRHSILSQVGSSVIDSSTLNFAVQYSIPMVTGNSINTESDDTGPTPTAGPGATIEVGMTDLLDGYQHTETKQTNEAVLEEDGLVGKCVDKKSKHTPKTSEEQSFKSCTDLPDMTDHPTEEPEAGSLQSSELPEPNPPFKDSDARSFKTCKDAVTPDRAVLLPPVRLPSSSLPGSDVKLKRPLSEIPKSSPPRTVPELPSLAKSEPSLPKGVAKLQNISKPSFRTGSTAVSISSSTGSSILQPPHVPPRESSSSKEAERSQAVAGFLVQTGRRFSRAKSHFARKEAKDGGSASQDRETLGDIPTPPPLRERPLSGHVVGLGAQPPEAVKTTEKVFAKEVVVPDTKTASVTTADDKLVPQERIAARTSEMKAVPIVHQYSLSTPSPIIPEPSSVYSPDNISSSKTRIQASLAPYPNSPGHDRRDSQSTTHLSWHGPKSLSMPSRDGGDGRVGQANGREETTTDLRFSAYKYPMNHLPDLKEESHEDSSLNTSASNLKNSSFRFPPGGQPGVRASVDEGAMFGHNMSVNSNQGSSLAQTRGLPSMNFSHMNLIEKLQEALDMDSASLLEGVPDDAEDMSPSGPLRPSSPGDIREKVRSFVAGLNELEQTGGATQPRLADLMQNRGLFSREALMAEIEKLDIPSVEALTQRLSALLPSLREYYERGEEGEFAEEEVIMEHALEEINEVGGPAPKRSSARLRPMPGSPNMVVVDDILYEELTSKEKGDTSSPEDGGERLSEKRHGENGAAKGRSWSVAHPRTRDQTASVDLETPSPAALRTRSLSLGDSEVHTPQDISFVFRRSLQSPVSTPTATETRPWNSDKNYPWAATTPSVDIALPSPSAVKASPRPGLSHLRNRISDSSSSTTTTTTDTLSPDGTFSSPLLQSGAMVMPGSDDPYTHARRTSGNQIHWSQYSAPVNPASPGQGISHLQTPGERYPTSALSLPMDLHFVDDITSGLYDETQDPAPAESSTRKLFSFVKRIGGRKKASPHEESTLDTRGAHIPASASEGQIADGEGDARAKPNRETYTNAQGMPAGTYHRERIFDKIKKWFSKGGKFIQGLRRQKPAAPRGHNDAIATTAPPAPPVQPPPPVHQSDNRPRNESPPLLIYRTHYRSHNRNRRDDPPTLSVVSE